MDRIETATDIVSSSASRLCLDMRLLGGSNEEEQQPSKPASPVPATLI